jgi:hypothetical protein
LPAGSCVERNLQHEASASGNDCYVTLFETTDTNDGTMHGGLAFPPTCRFLGCPPCTSGKEGHLAQPMAFCLRSWTCLCLHRLHRVATDRDLQIFSPDAVCASSTAMTCNCSVCQVVWRLSAHRVPCKSCPVSSAVGCATAPASFRCCVHAVRACAMYIKYMSVSFVQVCQLGWARPGATNAPSGWG